MDVFPRSKPSTRVLLACSAGSTLVGKTKIPHDTVLEETMRRFALVGPLERLRIRLLLCCTPARYVDCAIKQPEPVIHSF